MREELGAKSRIAHQIAGDLVLYSGYNSSSQASLDRQNKENSDD